MTKKNNAANINIAAENKGQMVSGSDVLPKQKEATEADVCEFPDVVSNFILDEVPGATKASNDNLETSGDSPDGGVASVPPPQTTIEEMDVQQQSIEKALMANKKFLPKEEFELRYKEAFTHASEYLRYEMELGEKIRNIETAQGVRKDLGGSATNIRTKKEILWQDFGLKEKTAWELVQLTPELVKKIDEKAKNEQRLPTRGLGILILEKEKKIQAAEEAEQEKAEKIKPPKKAEETAKNGDDTKESEPRDFNGELFNVIYVDPDQTKKSINDIYDMNIPVADDAILFWWVQAGKLFEAVSVIQNWGFQYAGEAIWDLEGQPVYSGTCFTQTHRILLIATRGENSPLIEKDTRKKKSVFALVPEFDLVEKPAYYRESIERMFSENGKFLDLFATTSSNSIWTPGMQEEVEATNGTDSN